jgi:hypothetical protein
MTLITLNNIYKTGVQVLSLGGLSSSSLTRQCTEFAEVGFWEFRDLGFGELGIWIKFFIILSFESKTEKKKKVNNRLTSSNKFVNGRS